MQKSLSDFKEGEIDVSQFQNKDVDRKWKKKALMYKDNNRYYRWEWDTWYDDEGSEECCGGDERRDLMAVSREFENIESFRKQPIVQQEQIIERLNQQLAKTQINQEKQRIKLKLDELKKELRAKEVDQAKAVDLSKKEVQNQYKLEEKHTKTMAKLQLQLTKRQRDNMMKRLKRMIADKEKNREKQLRFNQKMTEHANKFNARQAEEELKKRSDDLLKMEQKRKIETSSVKDKGAAFFEMIVGFFKMLKDGLVWLCKSLFNAITLLKWCAGCSWDQGLQGVITGPNTLTSLGTSFILAIKASISWLIYSCITASGGNILISFLFATIFLALGTALVNIVQISPLSTVWTFFEFKWRNL